MKTPDAAKFHKLYGVRRQRTNFQKKDYADYVVMILASAALIWFSYGAYHIVSIVGLALCAYMLVNFPIRHGAELHVPIVIKRPQDLAYTFLNKLQNAKLPYFLAIGLLVLENYLISLTPNLPHKLELTHTAAVGLFWGHFLLLTAYRTTILVAHLLKKEHVRDVLMESVWKRYVGNPARVPHEILHAYITGLLTHIVFLIPWYLVIKYCNFSLVFMPVTCLAAYFIQKKNVTLVNEWFYRDHWLGHNSEFDFVYEHGTHHDAIPSSLIGVAGNGIMEGFFRSSMAFPIPFYNPLLTAFFYTADVKLDMDMHQYIPGVFPKLDKEFLGVIQHSLHHYGLLEPYGFAINLDQPVSDKVKKQTSVLPDELKYSWRLDNQLTGYKWDSSKSKWFLALIDKYHDGPVKSSKKEAQADESDTSKMH